MTQPKSMVSLSVPMDDFEALNRASLFFSGLANDVSSDAHIDTTTAAPAPAAETAAPAPAAETAAPAPAAETAAPAPAATGTAPENEELDDAGFPWDERINTTSRLKTVKDGRFKKIKNLDKNHPGLYDQVIAELTAKGYGPNATRSAAPAPTADTAAPAPTADTAAPAPTADTAAPAPTADTAAPAPTADTAAPAPTATPMVMYVIPGHDGKFTREQLKPAGWTDEAIDALEVAEQPQQEVASPGITFPEFMGLVRSGLDNNTVTNEQITAELSKHGLSSLPLLSAQPQLIPTIKTALFG